MDIAGISITVKLYRIRAQLTMRLHHVCTAQGKGLCVDLDILRVFIIFRMRPSCPLFQNFIDLSESFYVQDLPMALLDIDIYYLGYSMSP